MNSGNSSVSGNYSDRDNHLLFVSYQKREEIKRILITMVFFLVMLGYPLGGTALGVSPWDHGQLQVSANGRYLEHADGTPFFWFGDTAWALFYRLTPSEANIYFNDRKNLRYAAARVCCQDKQGKISTASEG